MKKNRFSFDVLDSDYNSWLRIAKCNIPPTQQWWYFYLAISMIKVANGAHKRNNNAKYYLLSLVRPLEAK